MSQLTDIILWASLIEFAGALLLVGYILSALYELVHTRSITRARLIVADGVITSLSFKLAGTLLKTITLSTWQQILMFSAIMALRIILKSFFNWERAQLLQMPDNNALSK